MEDTTLMGLFFPVNKIFRINFFEIYFRGSPFLKDDCSEDISGIDRYDVSIIENNFG